jgi:hypothetical protein
MSVAEATPVEMVSVGSKALVNEKLAEAEAGIEFISGFAMFVVVGSADNSVGTVSITPVSFADIAWRAMSEATEGLTSPKGLSNVFAQQMPVFALSVEQTSHSKSQHHFVSAPLEQSAWSLLGCLDPTPRHGFWIVQHFLYQLEL